VLTWDSLPMRQVISAAKNLGVSRASSMAAMACSGLRRRGRPSGILGVPYDLTTTPTLQNPGLCAFLAHKVHQTPGPWGLVYFVSQREPGKRRGRGFGALAQLLGHKGPSKRI